MVQPALSITDLNVSIAGVKILDGISFSIASGEVAWLEGPNGAGKSTLLRAVAGLVPFQGAVLVS
jgi:ABC-type Mn2+/Zn2+ transport system ATPase subunit